MTKLRALILSQSLLSVVLAFCLQVCCCHSGFLVGLFGNAEAAAAEPACCALCTENEPAETPRDSQPLPACKICCVKGTGLKDVTPLPPLTLAFAPALPVTVDLPVEGERHVRTLLPSTGPPRPADSSLLRLGCALIV